MILRVVLACLLFSGPAFAASPVSLTGTACPYADDDIPSGASAECHDMRWQEGGQAFSTTVAILTPDRPGAPVPQYVVYIPGGPGDAPVNKGGDIRSIHALFPDHTLITLNPRGVKGASPRPHCLFGSDFWIEDIPPEDEAGIVTACRDKVTLDLATFDAPYLARDINRMLSALDVKQASVFAISYGTETALHLMAEKAAWLDKVILDSISLPGAIGTDLRLKARDRFLRIVDRLCFAQKQCPQPVTSAYEDLMDWAAQFDEDPVQLLLGPHKKAWSLDAADMLEFIASLTSYPDGAGYGPLFIEAFEDSRTGTARWIKSELEYSFDYAINNFALLYNAFSDSRERFLPLPDTGNTLYPVKIQDLKTAAQLVKLWNNRDRHEERFVTSSTRPEPANVPVLMMSGAADHLTPLEWATDVNKRFSGLTHAVFPELGHAVAFGNTSEVNDKGIRHQLTCGPDMIRAFMTGTGFGDCRKYIRKNTYE